MKPWSPHLLPRTPAHSYNIRRLNPPKLLLASFLVLILVGTALLKLPFATHDSITLLEAAFTATSAVTVTGLAVVDTGGDFTLFGQLVILVLIQLGGLGLMTFAVLMAFALGFRLGLRHQLVVQEVLNQPALGSVRRAAFSIALFALITEALGMILLAAIWVPEKGWATGLYHGLFYSISAFNNAGFALASDSLSAYATSWPVSLTITGLFIIGGLGYLVVMELITRRRFSKMSVYARLVLTTTLVLNISAAALFYLFEMDNPETLAALPHWSDRLIAAWFQGTTPRTAGFNSVDIGEITVASSVMFLLLMFIGGASNSTASGIKVSTFLVMLAATRSFLRGNLEVSIGRHSLSSDVVTKALAITTIAMMTIFLAILVITSFESARFVDLSFEVVSAFGTVGLSRGITAELSPASQMILMLVMLIGRIGPLTLGYVLTLPSKQHIRYARTELPLG
ncbi:Ktr system potassium transporter B [Proteobacteria bacterium 005FR1]|nr:Ktr system potassium transporter B [Proteobacteria bacterium 005FR1]